MKIGIVSNANDWMTAFKDLAACAEVSRSLLWWLDQDEYTQIGGWETPYMQVLKDIVLCDSIIFTNKVISSE